MLLISHTLDCIDFEFFNFFTSIQISTDQASDWTYFNALSYLLNKGYIMNIMIIGAGYVGLTVANGLAEVGYNIFCIEKNSDKLAILTEGVCPI